MNQTNTTYSWSTPLLQRGTYDLVLTACEKTTSQLLCSSSNHTIYKLNNIPTVSQIDITSTSTLNISNGTLRLGYNATDADGDSITDTSIIWYIDDALNTSFNNLTIIGSGNITHGEVWKSAIRVYDSFNWSSFSSNASITIVNFAPTTPTSRYPSTNVSNTLNTSYYFNCSGSTDPIDNDTILYEFWIGNTSAFAMRQNSTDEEYTHTWTGGNGTYLFNCRANDNYSGVSSFFDSNISIHYNTTRIIQIEQYRESTAQSGSLQYYSFNVSYYDLVVSDVHAQLLFNQTLLTVVETNETNETSYLASYFLPLSQSDNVNISWNITLDLSNGSRESYFYNYSQNITSFSFNTECNTSNATVWAVLNLTFRDEINRTHEFTDFDATFFVYTQGNDPSTNKSQSLSLNSINQTYICMSATNSTNNYTAYAQFRYYTTASNPRDYYIINMTLDNVTDNVDLFSLPSTLASGISHLIEDGNYLPLEGLYIDAQRYYVGTNTYKTVAMGKSDKDGYDNIFLRKNDVYYRYFIKNDTRVVFTSSPQKLTADEISFSISEPTFSELLTAFGNVQTALTFDNTTKTYTLSYSSLDGTTVTDICLRATKINTTNFITYCDTCDTASSGTITCTVSGDDGTYIGQAYLKSNPESFVESLIIVLGANSFLRDVGLTGVLMTIIFAGTVAFAGIWSPVLAIILFLAALFASSILGLINLPLVTILGLACVGGILIYKLRT